MVLPDFRNVELEISLIETGEGRAGWSFCRLGVSLFGFGRNENMLAWPLELEQVMVIEGRWEYSTTLWWIFWW